MATLPLINTSQYFSIDKQAYEALVQDGVHLRLELYHNAINGESCLSFQRKVCVLLVSPLNFTRNADDSW